MLLKDIYKDDYKIKNEDVVLGKIVQGNKIRDDFESIKNIVELEKTGYNQILGRVEKQELRGPFRNGSFLLEVIVYDGTIAMTVKMFIQEEMRLNVGGYYAFSGNVEVDKF